MLCLLCLKSLEVLFELLFGLIEFGEMLSLHFVFLSLFLFVLDEGGPAGLGDSSYGEFVLFSDGLDSEEGLILEMIHLSLIFINEY